MIQKTVWRKKKKMISVADNVSSPHPPGSSRDEVLRFVLGKKKRLLSLLGGDGEYFMQEARCGK